MLEPKNEPGKDGIHTGRGLGLRRSLPGEVTNTSTLNSTDDELALPARGTAFSQRGVVCQATRGNEDGPHFPPWGGPIVGVLVFGLLSALASYRSEGRFSPVIILGGAGIGLFIGLVVWLCDRPSGRGEFLEVTDQGSFAWRFLAVVSIGFSCAPVLGLIIASWAVFANRRQSTGWPRLVSYIGFALALLFSAWFLLILVMANSLN